MRYLLLLLPLVACRAPDEVTLSPFYSSGQSAIGDRAFGLETNNSGVMVDFTWALGKKYESYDAIIRMGRRAELELALKAAAHDDHGPTGGTTVVIKGDEAEAPEKPKKDGLGKWVEPPEDKDSAIAYLIGALGFLVFAMGIFLFHKIGLLALFLPAKKRTPE